MKQMLHAICLKRKLKVSVVITLMIFVSQSTIAQTAQQRLQIQQKTNTKGLDSLQNVFTKKYITEETKVETYLKNHPQAKRIFNKNGSTYFLKYISKDGQPVYINTKNRVSGQMIGADQLYTGGSVGANVNGTGMVAGVWDGGQVRATHELLSGKVAMQPNQTLNSTAGNDHMTHVSGTIAGKDIANQPSARGIAYNATLLNWDFADDEAEMTVFASGGYLLSNHSYGLANDNTTPVWQFGAYDQNAKNFDIIAKNAPMYLPFIAAGNEQQSNGNASKNGYDLISGASAAKNVVTVGALNGDSAMSDYSNWGPTDDGRFKPDIVAKGTGINSSISTGDQAYSGNGVSSSGTSYSTPAVTGCGVLLQQYYRNLTNTYMRAATLKAVMLHTAFDLGNPGPDYKFGWGLMSADKAGLLIKKAKASAAPAGASITEFTTNPVNNGIDEMVLSVIANGTEPLKVSIGWTDNEGTEQTSADGTDPTTGRLVYHFDILVRANNTLIETRPWRPMGMANRTANASKGTAWFEGDNNNYRQVLISNPVAGATYTIVIRKSSTSPVAVRPFSLIVSGLRLSTLTDYFRTKQSGNWNDVNTWESSSDNITWQAATLTPDFNSNTITIQNTHTVTVSAGVTIDQATVSSGASLVVNPAIVLTVNNGPGNDLTVSTGAKMTVSSSATGTGSIGNSTGIIIGDVTVERYISNKRAWRLLGVPLSSSTQTIKSSWMEGGSTAAGFGTQITTFNGDGNAANFDAQKLSSSIRIYSAGTFNSDATHTPNTTNIISANPAYFLFVRGDRSIDRTTGGAATSATTLRINGTVKQGDITGVGVSGTGFSLIQNPYPSAVDFEAVRAVAGQSGLNTFYVWDATMGGTNGVGQYRTITRAGDGSYSATPGTTNTNYRFIESGTAFFVPGNNTFVTFTEATKSAGIPPSSMLRTTSGTETELALNLNIINADNTASVADGVRMVFDNAYKETIDNNDAKKITGFERNFGIVNNNEILSIDKRPIPNQSDVIALKLWSAAIGNYQLEVQPSNFSAAGVTPYIFDSYLNTYTPVDINNAIRINFSITADAASAAANRFSVVFKKPGVTNLNPSIVIYPNPVENGIIKLQMNNMPKGVYNVRILNASGQTFLTKKIDHAGGNNTQTINVNNKGTYMLEVIKPDLTKQVNKVVIN